MQAVTNSLIQLINAQTQYFSYVETNGVDGSETYLQLKANRDNAEAQWETDLAAFVDARIAAAATV